MPGIEVLVDDAWWSGKVLAIQGSGSRREKAVVQFDAFPFGAGDQGVYDLADIRSQYAYEHRDNCWRLVGQPIGGSKDAPEVITADMDDAFDE